MVALTGYQEQCELWLKFYFARGFSIIPCRWGEKVAAVPWTEYQTRRATWEEIEAWFLKGTERNVALVLGAVSGIACLDRDRWKPDYPAGKAKLDLLGLSEDALQPTVMTPRKGLHQYFALNGKVPSNVSIAPGVEFRSEGAIVVAPPSRMKTTQGGIIPYTWKPGCRLDNVPLPPLPACLGGVKEKEKERFSPTPPLKEREKEIREPSLPSLPPSLQGKIEKRTDRELDREALGTEEPHAKKADISPQTPQKPATNPVTRETKCLGTSQTMTQACNKPTSTPSAETTVTTVTSQSQTIIGYKIQGFQPGSRDNDLFRLAFLLARGSADQGEIRIVLDAMMRSQIGKRDHEGRVYSQRDHDGLIDMKTVAGIRAALKKEALLEGTIAESVRVLMKTETRLSLSEIYRQLNILDINGKTCVRQALLRSPSIRSCSRGIYEWIEQDVETMDLWEGNDTEELKLLLPMGLERYCRLYPGNIVLVQGCKSSGKTAFMLNIVHRNLRNWDGKVNYFNSEMGEAELITRLKLFEEDFEQWKRARFIPWFNPDRTLQGPLEGNPGCINVLDFLEIYNEFWLVGQKILDIHVGLAGKGVCFVAVQKDRGKERGRGGGFSWEKPRLIIDLDRDKDGKNICTIVDCKSWKGHTNPNGKKIEFKLVGGHEFLVEADDD